MKEEIKDENNENKEKWIKWQKFNKKYLDVYAADKEALPPAKDSINPYRLIKCLSEQLDEEAIIVCADGTACVVGFQATK